MGSLSKINDIKLKKRGRNYDPVHGVCCHWCRQKTVDDHVKCSNCPLRFCGLCLLNRHGEDIWEETQENVRWVCPRCRGGCGAGCTKSCCNCGPCRKIKRLDPTGPLVRVARSAGFNNVHDYLIHLETGESSAAIASRKVGRGWTAIDSSLVVVMEHKLEHQLEHDGNLAWAKKEASELTVVCGELQVGQSRADPWTFADREAFGGSLELHVGDWQKAEILMDVGSLQVRKDNLDFASSWPERGPCTEIFRAPFTRVEELDELLVNFSKSRKIFANAWN